MLVYRLSKTQYADDLNGTGAKLFGGRWNHIDTACIYTAESRALAVLEYTVNSNINFIPRALSICTLEINEEEILEISHSKLPGNWREIPAPFSTKEFGTDLFKKNCAILKIPSVIIPNEFNYLINPFILNSFRLIDINDFIYDVRIKQNN